MKNRNLISYTEYIFTLLSATYHRFLESLHQAQYVARMKKGDLVVLDVYPDFLVEDGAHTLLPDRRDEPGIIIKGPYGGINATRSRFDGKVIESVETKVVDVLFGKRVVTKIPIENLKVIK